MGVLVLTGYLLDVLDRWGSARRDLLMWIFGILESYVLVLLPFIVQTDNEDFNVYTPQLF